MQVQSSWKVAANLELLYGFAHPPAQLHTTTNNNNDQVITANTRTSAEKASLMEFNIKKVSENDKNNNDNMNADVDARNTCNIDNTFYGSVQDVMSSIKVKRELIRYYYFMLSKIDLRDDVKLFGMELEQELNKSEEITQEWIASKTELTAATTSKNEEEVSEEQQKENTVNNINREEEEWETVKYKHDNNVDAAKLEVKSEIDLACRSDTNINYKLHKDCEEEQEEEQLEKKEEELEQLEEERQLKHNSIECNSHVRDGKGSDDYRTENVKNVKSNTEVNNGDAKKPSYSFRARGILTEIHDSSLLSSEALLPWEFYVINTNSTNWEDWNDEDNNNDNSSDDDNRSVDEVPDYNDKHIISEKGTIRYREQYNDEINNTERVEEYTNAFRALVKEKISLPSFVRAIAQQSIMQDSLDKNKTHFDDNSRSSCSTKSVHDQNRGMSFYGNANKQSYLQNDQTCNAFAHSDSVRKTRNRLSLYIRLAESFTGIYPGMAIGIIGEPFQWSATGVLTGVLVHKFVLPSRPCFPWSRSEAFEVMMPCKYKCERSLKLSTSREQENEKEEEEEEQSNDKPNEKKTEDEVSKRLVDTPEVEHKEKSVCYPVADRSLLENTLTNMTRSAPMRIHFCSGPFPRRDTHALLRIVVTQALTREADLLVIGGPLIKPFEEFDKQLLPLIKGTFNDLLDGYVDVIEETLQQWREEHKLTPYNKDNSECGVMLPHPHRLKVILVPHRDDVTQIPVLPQTLYALSDTEDIYMRSNPCRISYRGVHIGVCNEDVVGVMQEQMAERWPHTEGNLRRVVETLVQSRVYTPIMQLPLKTIDVHYLHKLRIDYEPHRSSIHVENTNKMNSSELMFRQREKTNQCRWENNWNLLKSYLFYHNAQPLSRHALSSNKENAITVKRAKTESLDDNDNNGEYDSSTTSKNEIKRHQRNVKNMKNSRAFDNSNRVSSVEFMPHIIFLPSTRPQFAYVTHRGVANTSPHNKLTAPLKKIVDEANIDNVEDATGVLVINQEVWSRRTSAQFSLRVAEVTISDSRRVALCGARASTGVSCGLLHIFNANV